MTLVAYGLSSLANQLITQSVSQSATD